VAPAWMLSAAARALSLPARRGFSSAAPAPYECITYEKKGRVGLLTLCRPKVNALSTTLVRELAVCAKAADADVDVAALVITGSTKFFAAGADIAEMSSLSYMEMYRRRLFGELDGLQQVSIPVIAAVNGFALGGGCELAMACDFILAGDSAVFGQPEIKLGTIPGLGGTQRFTRAIGKARAMELVLTGDHMTAEEAVARGLASRIVPASDLVADALDTARKIAAQSKPIVSMAKTAVNASFETSLSEGLHLERQLFYSTFATEDQKIGMKAFVDKATPEFRDC